MSARVVVTRGGQVESEHVVHVAVSDGRSLIASAGDAELRTFLRSAAKPLQALPLVEDGGARRFRLTGSEVALSCASHNAEPRHVRAALSILRKAGLEEGDLACGPHPPLGVREATRMASAGEKPRAVHNNCSGKHAGMLVLAVHHGWPTEDYHRAGHPVQERMRATIARWSGLAPAELGEGVDGCGVVNFALPVRAMADAFARLGRAAAEGDEGPAAVLDAVVKHPFMLAGTARLCTALLKETKGRVVAKTGAEGVYCATVPGQGLGIALKVADGARRAADVALIEVLARLELLEPAETEALSPWRRPLVLNTRGERVGEVYAEVELERRGRRKPRR